MHTKPQVGDVGRFWFPEWPSPHPGPKARPCLIMDIEVREGNTYVKIAYGTSQRTQALNRGEFNVLASEKTEWSACNDKDTKFVLRNTDWFPLDERWFVDVVGHIRTPGLIRKLRTAAGEVGI